MLGLDYMGKHKGGKGGTIVNIASTAFLDPFYICPVYTSSKFAVAGFSLALEVIYIAYNMNIITLL